MGYRPGRLLPGGLTEQAGGAAARQLLAEGLPTAVIAFNDRPPRAGSAAG